MKFSTIEIPDEHIFFKSDYFFAFVNIKPFLPNHILLSPIRCVQRLSELTEIEGFDMFKSIKSITTKLGSLGTSWTITIQDGEEAGQTVKHLHVHMIPRIVNDLNDNNDVYKGIAMDSDRKTRDYTIMKKEANYLKNLINSNNGF